MENKIYPKVLVVSHNAFSTTSNMGKTMAAFFYGWEKENIAQMYFHMEFPDSDICENYFRVTDFEMIDSIIKFKKPGGVLGENEIKLDTSSNNLATGIKSDIYKMGKKKKSYMYSFRNLIWDSGKWKTQEFIDWIDVFNPEVVFYAAGDYMFSMKIAISICEMKNIPLVVFFGDDYYFNNIHKGWMLNMYNKNKFRNEFMNLFSYLSSFIAASDKMLREYNSVFHKAGYAIMTSTEIRAEEISHNKTNEIKISYIGNLGGGRWKSLREISECLKRMGISLNVYSGENRNSILKELNEENGILFHGSIPANKVNDIIKSSTIVIHVESMDNINIERTQYSMSTKIAESLGSGVCIFAYGPKDVSSMEYLIENKAACVVTDKQNLEAKLMEIINCKELRDEYISNALRLAVNRHNFMENSELFYKIITESIREKKGHENENITS
ncbi:glycosyltransferase family protein [Paenibacillus donghaensis]|uniref:Spore protein YkvP/CgeB glycosyl transferase-like domain-containing protein n=1 Tax=Paenibacillus donghaensis TaxID=414771 RepID=A0A2Z2KSY7_9BACL|nr:hypothetical protein [Paenibacillus donghaensis]ASA23811.1 hypothetical protein B9T62_25325 [Paenibacillus donghaensis]